MAGVPDFSKFLIVRYFLSSIENRIAGLQRFVHFVKLEAGIKQVKQVWTL